MSVRDLVNSIRAELALCEDECQIPGLAPLPPGVVRMVSLLRQAADELDINPALLDEAQLLRRAQKYGGSFMCHLATAWQFADPVNTDRLRKAFNDLLEGYSSAPHVGDEW